jgi:hypothetical protein
LPGRREAFLAWTIFDRWERLVPSDHAHCGTFVQISFRAGVERTGLVGACHRADCTYNEKLECTAASVRVGAGADVADCLTYQAR